MSSYRLKSAKKLVHIQKMCTSFITKILRSKVRRIINRKSINTVTAFLVLSRQKIRILSITRQRSTTSNHNHINQTNPSVIFIDELYVQEPGEPSRDSTSSNNEEMVELRGVDKRAEEFILKFRENLMLERETSMEEFREMLARGIWFLFHHIKFIYFTTWTFWSNIFYSPFVFPVYSYGKLMGLEIATSLVSQFILLEKIGLF